MTIDLNDDLSGLFGGSLTDAPIAAPVNRAPADFVPAVERFREGCPKCRGTGRFVSYSGRDCGPCFACKGAGSHTYKTSPEKRAQARQGAAERKGKALAAWIEANREICEWLTKAADSNARRGGTFTFPQAMLDAIAKYGSLTDGQDAAVRKLMARDAERATEREARKAAAPAVDVSRIEEAFATARDKAARKGQVGVWLKPLRLRDTTSDLDIAFQPGSKGSQWEGMIFVKAGDRKLGAIKAGKFERRFACTDADEAAVVAVCADPSQAAIAYGKAWSICAVCSRTLTDDESIARGIGPICADKMGW